MLKKIFYGNITEGKLALDNRELFDDYLKQLGEIRCELTIKKFRKKRSDKQNAYYWVCLNAISTETGEFPETLHETFKAMFLKKQIKIKNKIINVVGSTTELDGFGFTEYIEKISNFMADFSIILPYPEDYEI